MIEHNKKQYLSISEASYRLNKTEPEVLAIFNKDIKDYLIFSIGEDKIFLEQTELESKYNLRQYKRGDFYTIKEAALRLKYSIQHVNRLFNEKKFTSMLIRSDRKRYITKEEIDSIANKANLIENIL